ncbi:MAG TPA: flagellar basal body-associated FliL family protein [Melioribacteraceae bacterium]|nr:flagellar basal body-associated FliL family protein [Melioribacteraceae bacterium]
MADEQGGKKGFNPKVLIIGLPLFIIQLLAVYYVTANILLTKIVEQQGLVSKSEADSLDADLQEKKEPEGNHIFKVEDLIVNPAGTSGQRILLVSLGIDVPSEENLKVLEAKNVILKDMIITILSAKTLQELGDIGTKEGLKTELITKIDETFRGVKVTNIYFDKYVIN